MDWVQFFCYWLCYYLCISATGSSCFSATGITLEGRIQTEVKATRTPPTGATEHNIAAVTYLFLIVTIYVIIRVTTLLFHGIKDNFISYLFQVILLIYLFLSFILSFFFFNVFLFFFMLIFVVFHSYIILFICCFVFFFCCSCFDDLFLLCYFLFVSSFLLFCLFIIYSINFFVCFIVVPFVLLH